jgi:hypothetical protein
MDALVLNIFSAVLLVLIFYYIYKFFKMAEQLKLYLSDTIERVMPIRDAKSMMANLVDRFHQ